MKKLYATLFSALVVGCAVCAGCTTKKVSSSAEVVDIIQKSMATGRQTIRNTGVLSGTMPLIIPETWRLTS